jgi:hypothetical protein
MGMLRLAPEIQQHVLSLPDLPAATGAAQAGMARRQAITERALRPIAKLENVTDQKARFEELIDQVE